MKKDLNNYIKELSKRDKKTLSQKGLKLAEETGELAKVILPYDSAHGTNHRFINKEQLLDAIADVYLTNISIGYSLGFTDEEINDTIARKSENWGRLQVREDEAQFPLPYETHVTISYDQIDDSFVERFKNDCRTIGVKPIVLDLQMKQGNLKDVMTSSKHFGNNRTAYEECKRISRELYELGYNVVREKIESVPWHPSSPKEDDDTIPKDCYYEAHIACIISMNEKKLLEAIAEDTKSHLSRNFFKKVENDRFVNMLTYRSYDSKLEEFNSNLENIKQKLSDNNINFEKVVTEFSIYDTKVSHDYQWVNA